MPHAVKGWRDAALGPDGLPLDPQPAGATPLDAAALEDLEERVYGSGAADLVAHATDTTAVHGIADTAALAVAGEFVQGAPAAEWLISHGRGRKPAAVSVLDTAGTVVLAEVQHTSDNAFAVRLGAPFGGRVVYA